MVDDWWLIVDWLIGWLIDWVRIDPWLIDDWLIEWMIGGLVDDWWLMLDGHAHAHAHAHARTHTHTHIHPRCILWYLTIKAAATIFTPAVRLWLPESLSPLLQGFATYSGCAREKQCTAYLDVQSISRVTTWWCHEMEKIALCISHLKFNGAESDIPTLLASWPHAWPSWRHAWPLLWRHALLLELLHV